MRKPNVTNSSFVSARQSQGEVFYVGSVVVINLIFGFVAYTTANDPMSGVSAVVTYAMWAGVLVPIDIYLIIYFFKLRRRTQDGQLIVGSTTYSYVIGNTLTWYADQSTMPDMVNTQDKADLVNVTSRFRGLKVTLPVKLPHVYFDNQRDWGILTPYLVDPSQKLNLEGDFPSEYSVYVPRGGEIEALSVFQPDVLHAIMRHAQGYDVEVYNNELRIISRRSVSGSAERQQQLQNIAVIIIKELESRFSMWSRLGFKSRPLIIYRLHGVMIGRCYISFAHMAAFVLLVIPGLVLGFVTLDILFELTGSVSAGEKGSLLLGTMLLSAICFAGYWAAATNLKHKELAIRSMWGKPYGKAGETTARPKK